MTQAVLDDEALRRGIEGRIPLGRVGDAAEVAGRGGVPVLARRRLTSRATT